MKAVLVLALLLGLVAHRALGQLPAPDSSSESSGSSGSFGSSSGSNGEDTDDHPEDIDRDVSLNINADSISLRTDTKSITFKQRSEIRYQIEGDRLEIELRSYTRDTTKTDFKFKWKVAGIVEYTENGAHIGFQPTEDTIGTTWRFDKTKFVFKALPDTGLVKNFQAQSTDLVFTIIGHISGSTFAANGDLISPGSQKFDILIDTTNFVWKNAGSRLALVGRMQSNSKTRTVVKDQIGNDVAAASPHSRRVLFGADAAPTAFFDWKANVTVDFANPPQSWASVITSALTIDDADKDGETEGENSKLVSHAFDVVRPLKITWDPSVGVGAGAFADSAASPLAAASLPLLALLAAAAALLTRSA